MTLSILCFNKSSVIFNRASYKMKNLEKKKSATWQRKIALKFLSLEGVSKNVATLLNCCGFSTLFIGGK